MEVNSSRVRISSSPATSSRESGRPSWKKRFLAVAFYLGLAPLLRPFGIRRDDPFVQHHAAQALATILVLLVILVGGFAYGLLMTFAIRYHREVYESIPAPEGWSGPERDVIPLGMGLLAWLAVWGGGLILAVSSSIRALPLFGRLALRPRLVRVAWVGNVLLGAGVFLTTGMALHASFLTRQDDEPAPVYLLYDDMGSVPRWVFNLGIYRTSRAATARWGPGSVVVAPLDEHHLRLALRHGRFVFLACHGQDGYILTPSLWISPPPLSAPGLAPSGPCLFVASREAVDSEEPWTVLPAGESLQLVYSSACDCGVKADQWEDGLAPAEVKTFNRLSTVAEHFAWLWDAGPARVWAMK